jgi:branched-chain amino acid transport system ATP-binding protein
VVEQNAKQAVSIADRTYVLEQGRIALQGGKSILKDKKVKNVYFGGE